MKSTGFGSLTTNWGATGNIFPVFSENITCSKDFTVNRHLTREVLFELLERFGLAGRTSFVDDRLTNLKLSAGQKKRLALACSYIEDKPVFLFDEIAADLDAEFREFFYGVFLAELKEQGKNHHRGFP